MIISNQCEIDNGDILAAMTRKVTKSAKVMQEWRKRKIEKPADLPDKLKHATIEFHYRCGKEAPEIIKLTKLQPRTVRRAIKRFQEEGSSARRSMRAGRPSTAVTKENIKKARFMIWRNSEIPICEIGRRLCIDEKSAARIIHKLNKKSYRLGRGQYLTDVAKRNRVTKAQKMLDFLNEHPSNIKRILFSDEKWFSIERILNRQCHRQLLTKESKIGYKHVGKQAHPEKLMFWGGICATGKTKLEVLADKRPTRRNPNKLVCVSMDSAVYQARIISKRVLPDGKRLFGKKRWVYQQDGAPPHVSNSSVAFMRQAFTGRKSFWGKDMWPSCSPDLNPLDFRIWTLMQQKMGRKRLRSKPQLVRAVKRAWNSIKPAELKAIVKEFKLRLEICIAAKGGNFEHLLPRKKS